MHNYKKEELLVTSKAAEQYGGQSSFLPVSPQ